MVRYLPRTSLYRGSLIRGSTVFPTVGPFPWASQGSTRNNSVVLYYAAQNNIHASPPKWLETPRWSEVSKIHIHLKQYKEINWKTGISARKEGGHRTIRFHWGGEAGVDIVWNYISVRSHNYTILRCSFCLVVFNQYYVSSKQVHWPLLEHWHMVFFHSYEVIQRCNSTWWERELQPKEAQLLLLPLVLHSCFFVTVKTRSLK